MVKGTARRVIVVRSPDQKLFEQAIFLMREDAGGGVTAEQVLDQAREAADSYLRRNTPRLHLGRLKGWVWFLAGAACTAAAVLLLG